MTFWNYHLTDGRIITIQGTLYEPRGEGEFETALIRLSANVPTLNYRAGESKLFSTDRLEEIGTEKSEPKESPTEDVVNHPSHYTSDPSGVECIQITRHRNFNIGNAIKYLWRAGLKGDPGKSARQKQVEDLRKAVFYIQDEIKRIEQEG